MTEHERAFFAVIVIVLMFAAWLMNALAYCNDPKCAESHRQHTVAEKSAEIERNHNVFHGESQPNPLCALCAARKRDKDSS